VKKKGRAVKDALVTKIREAVQTYPNAFVFDVENMKNTVMKDVREKFTGAKSAAHAHAASCWADATSCWAAAFVVHSLLLLCVCRVGFSLARTK